MTIKLPDDQTLWFRNLPPATGDEKSQVEYQKLWITFKGQGQSLTRVLRSLWKHSDVTQWVKVEPDVHHSHVKQN